MSMGQVRQKLWQSMRVMRRFTLPQLMATADAEQGPAAAYVNSLKNAGYLRVEQQRQLGITGSHGVYQLLRDTGPKHPITNRVQVVYDPNQDSYHLPQQMKDRINATLAECTARGG